MRRLKLGYLLLIFTIFSAAVAQEQVSNDEQGFQLTLLPGWTQLPDKAEFQNTYLRVASPAGVEDGAIYLQIFAQGTYTPETYRTAVRRYVTTTMEGRILADQDITVNGREAWRLEYNGESVGYAGDRRHFLNTVIFHQDKIFVVHCASKDQVWDSVNEDFREISSTLELD